MEWWFCDTTGASTPQRDFRPLLDVTRALKRHAAPVRGGAGVCAGEGPNSQGRSKDPGCVPATARCGTERPGYFIPHHEARSGGGACVEAFLDSRNLYRKLAGKNPDTYDAALARALNNLGLFYRITERLSESERAYVESCALYRKLASRHRDSYQREVAGVCGNLDQVRRALLPIVPKVITTKPEPKTRL